MTSPTQTGLPVLMSQDDIWRALGGPDAPVHRKTVYKWQFSPHGLPAPAVRLGAPYWTLDQVRGFIDRRNRYPGYNANTTPMTLIESEVDRITVAQRANTTPTP